MLTIHVLGFGELYVQLLNAIATFMGQSFFSNFLKLTALVGIIMASVGFLKERNPLVYVKWVMSYVLVLQLVITPKTDVEIYDISAQKDRVVSNVPVIFAVTASLITSIGVGLAETYDDLFTLPSNSCHDLSKSGCKDFPSDLAYTKTGSLFGSKIIQAARDFRILDSDLKEEMSEYLRNCVIGDIRLNHKYSVGELSTTQHIWDLISKDASEVRMIKVNGTQVSCKIASERKGTYSLYVKLEAEIKKAYTIFGVNLFSHAKSTNYAKLFESQLTSSFDYYQMMTDTSAEIFLQSMMINAIGDGIKDYQAFTDSTAGVVNNQTTKSQVQHRWSWAIAGQKAAWFLPILHTLLTALLFGIFPIIIAMSTVPNGFNIFRGYIQFFISLQFWPVLFAILNMAMTIYGREQTAHFGGFNIVNIDKIDELHADLSGVAGYLMLMIPFLAKGLISNLSEAFNNLATSMTGHLQGSAMSVANDAASASFSFGQTSFYNTSANNYSANKHDNNWTHMHGMRSEQLATGVVKTQTGNGNTVFDVSPGMTKSAVSINASEALSGSLNQAFEESKQATQSESTHYQTSLSNFAHKAVQLSKLQGHDMRLGTGVSDSESSQYSQALSTMTHIATDVSKRMGVSQEEALAHLTGAGIHEHAGISTNRSVLGALASVTLGAQAGVDVQGRFDRTSSSQNRYHVGMDRGISAREARDFNTALNHVQHFTQTHHFDENDSQSSSFSKQMGADIREAQTASRNMEASLSRASRISEAQHYVQSHSAQINTDMNQAFPKFVASQVGESRRDQLFSNPGDIASLEALESLGSQFVAKRRDALLTEFGNKKQSTNLDATYQAKAHDLANHKKELNASYAKEERSLHADEPNLTEKGHQLTQKTQHQIKHGKDGLTNQSNQMTGITQQLYSHADETIARIKDKATNGVIPGHAVDRAEEFLHLKNKESI